MTAITGLIAGSSSVIDPDAISSAKEKRDALASRLLAAEELFSTRKAEATAIALDGAEDSLLDQAEARCREAADRISTLQAALSQAEVRLASVETQAKEQAEAKLREHAAGETERLAAEIEAAQQPLVNELRWMARLMNRAIPLTFEAQRAGDFCQALCKEIELAAQGMAGLLRSHAEHVRFGNREPIGPRGDDHHEHQNTN